MPADATRTLSRAISAPSGSRSATGSAQRDVDPAALSAGSGLLSGRSAPGLASCSYFPGDLLQAGPRVASVAWRRSRPRRGFASALASCTSVMAMSPTSKRLLA